MKVVTATSAGHDGRPNEDFVGSVPGVVVLLDGAGIPGTEHLCRHGVAWYSHTLGATLLERITRGVDLATSLAESIEHVAGLHRHTCDLADPSSPQATVAMLRVDDGRADYLVLADAYVVLAPVAAEPCVIADPREIDVRRECSVPLLGLSEGTPEYERVLPSVVDAFRARRNQPGGYWIAKDDPRAATEAVTGSVPLEDLESAALLSNGASRIVDPYRLADWPAVFDLLRTSGPDELLRRVREAEGEGADARRCDGGVLRRAQIERAARSRVRLSICGRYWVRTSDLFGANGRAALPPPGQTTRAARSRVRLSIWWAILGSNQ